MHTFTVPSVALAALAALPAVSAHGYVSGIVAGGKWYPGSNPNWYYQPSGSKPDTAGWYAMNQDNGFVSPDSYGTSDIACHKSATPGSTTIPVTAGSTIQLQWNTWPDSHRGPIMDYIAKGGVGSTAGSLSFVKIDEAAYISGSDPGTWVTDTLIANNFTWPVKIPSSLASGNYVLRHEIIGLHAAGQSNGAQNYPQCINLAVSGGGSASPSGEAATSFYKANDPGILFNLYTSFSSYPIPGPDVWSGAGGSGNTGGNTGGSGPTTTKATTTTAPTTMKTTTTAAQTTTTSGGNGGNCAAKYAQCGGKGWQGATCCVSGSTCKASGDYYSQCL